MTTQDDNVIAFKPKAKPPVPSELMFSLEVFNEGEGRLFEIDVVEDVTDFEVFSALMALACDFMPEEYSADKEPAND